MGKFGDFTFAHAVIFFLDVFVALLIITGASFLVSTNFGRIGLVFGFFTVLAVTYLEAIRRL